MLTPEFYEAFMGAIVGDDHAPTFPDVWQIGLFDEHGDELTQDGYERTEVPNTSEVWELDEDTATNLEPVDLGTPGEEWPDIHFAALMNEAGAPVFYAPLGEPVEGVLGQPLAIEPGGLTVTLGLEQDEEEE